MSNTGAGTPTPRQTEWQRRVASFRDAVRSGWRSYRLAPWLFQRAGRTESVPTPVQAFGSTELFPTDYFDNERSPRIDSMGREWGEQIAREETRSFLTLLGERCTVEPARERLADQVDRVLEEVARGSMRSVAIIVPARWQALRALELQRGPAELEWLPGAGARALYRGAFSGLPVFSPQQPGATDLWVIDFDRIATWQYVGGFDDLTTSPELLRDQYVRLNDALVLATRITAEEYFAITLDDPKAARGIRIPLEPTT